jgi:hypothetical protein
MSLSWRKRQAIASDQKTWRGLGVDSALWTSIDRNAGNVKASLGNSGSTGVVTGLKFVKTEGLDFQNTGQLDVFVSDPSNSSVASADGVNLFDTPHPSSNSCSGLIFTLKKFNSNASFGDGTPSGTDISGMKYYITSGGSGYNVGDDIILQGTNQRGRIQNVTGVASTTGISPNIPANSAVSQDAYKVFDISCEPGATATAGDTVEIKLAAAPNTVASTGILTANITGTSAQTIRVHAATDQTFNYLAPATNYFLEINGQVATSYGPETGANGAITEISTNPQVNGFTANQINNGLTTLALRQTLVQGETSNFSAVYSAIRSGSQLIVSASNAGAATYGNAYGDIRANSAPTIASSLINGRLTARVTSITNTEPEKGRN